MQTRRVERGKGEINIVQVLRGFDRLDIAPYSTQEAFFNLDQESTSIWGILSVLSLPLSILLRRSVLFFSPTCYFFEWKRHHLQLLDACVGDLHGVGWLVLKRHSPASHLHRIGTSSPPFPSSPLVFLFSCFNSLLPVLFPSSFSYV